MRHFAAALLLLACRRAPAEAPSFTVQSLLGGSDDAGYERALAPRPFVFPDDHGPHPGFRSEWWYLTGQLTASGRRFGYQLTMFRQALAPAAIARPSPWGARDAFMAHLAITDASGRRFRASERLARGAFELAGARAAPFAVWVESWRVEGEGAPFPLHLRARAEDVALDLMVEAGRGPVLQGERGLSAKGPEPGNASYYYSMTRLPTRGRVEIAGERVDVAGTSWLDREWSTSALGADLAGWDWLALELTDGRDLMIYRLRRKDGTAAPESRATIIDPSGATTVLPASGFALIPRGEWRSPRTGARYPLRWRLELPSQGLTLSLRPLLDDQELALSVHYWEGAVEAAGRTSTEPVSARGYLELTGYDGAPSR
jgi:predicted secreted hydrolase